MGRILRKLFVKAPKPNLKLERKKIIEMIRKCILRCKNATHNPIALPHNKNVIIGRSRDTKIKDKRCSKNQIELLANCETCSVTVRQIGANITSINGKPLKFGNTAYLEHRDSIEILSGEYFHIIEFEPPPEKLNVHSEITEKNVKKRKADVDEEAPPKKMERGDEGRKVPAGINCKQGWSSAGEGQLLIYNSDSVESRNKIAGYDMDGTLITTKSGKVFPVDYDDWQIIYPEVPGKLKKLWKEGYKIVIFTNQAGISRGKQTVAGIQTKIQSIIKKLGVPIQAFVSTGKGVYRKPMLGMWNYLKDQCNEGLELSVSECMYVGDAAGRTENVKRKDHSCADRLFAINIGITFYTPEEHFQGVKQQKFNMPEFDPHQVDENAELFEPSTTKVPQYPQEVIVLVGFPGSGKSFLSTTYLARRGYVQANRDTLKSWQKCVQVMDKALQEGKNVVIDNTNADVEARLRYIDSAKKRNVPVRCFMFNLSKDQCRHNNKFREFTGSDHPKVNDIIYNMWNKQYQEPTLAEGFKDLVKVNFVPQFRNEADEKLYKMYLLEK